MKVHAPSEEVGKELILPYAINAIRNYLAYLEEHDPTHYNVEALRRAVKRYDEEYGKDADGNSQRE